MPPHLVGEVAGHAVHRVGLEVLPDSTHAFDFRLAAQLALGADLAGHARKTSEAMELSWSTIVFMLFFNLQDLPLTSTVIFLDKETVGRRRRS